MEWKTPVNEMLSDEITKLDSTLIPSGFQRDVRALRVVQENLGKLIDSLGEQSAKAQGLNKAITTSEKLQNAPTHVLYLLKDAAAKNGEGEVIGFLKVAYKNLYLFNERDKVCQVEPMCVLDFFVSGTRQRRGYGRKLFDHMLQDTGTKPQNLAVDGPSAKMETFLAKNYGINQLIRQSNNFAVTPAFFNASPDGNKSGRSTPVVPSAAVGRFAARKPPSSISAVIHGATDRFYVETNNGTPEEYAPEPKPPSPEPEMEPAPEPAPEARAPAPEARAPASPTRERPTTLPVAPAVSVAPSPAGSAGPRRDSQLTDQGYFDVKFYHNKLCEGRRYTPVMPSEREASSSADGTGSRPQEAAGPSAMVEAFLASNKVVVLPALIITLPDARPFVYTNTTNEPTPGPDMEPEPEPVPEARTPASPTSEARTPASPTSEASSFPECPTTLPVVLAVARPPSPAGSVSPRRDSQLNEQGNFDIKFYHHKLW